MKHFDKKEYVIMVSPSMGDFRCYITYIFVGDTEKLKCKITWVATILHPVETRQCALPTRSGS